MKDNIEAQIVLEQAFLGRKVESVEVDYNDDYLFVFTDGTSVELNKSTIVTRVPLRKTDAQMKEGYPADTIDYKTWALELCKLLDQIDVTLPEADEVASFLGTHASAVRKAQALVSTRFDIARRLGIDVVSLGADAVFTPEPQPLEPGIPLVLEAQSPYPSALLPPDPATWTELLHSPQVF